MIWRPFNYQLWHRWFAWHPVTLENGNCAWLEMVERKRWHLSELGIVTPVTMWVYRQPSSGVHP